MTSTKKAYAISLNREPAQPAETHRAAWLNDRYGHLDGPALIRAVLHDQSAGRTAVVSSFGTESVALLHMVAHVAPGTPVLFLDSGKMFRETLDYVDELTETLGLQDVRRIRPGAHGLRRDDPRGDLWTREPRACCALRKVAPLQRALADFDTWITGRKRYQAETRTGLPLIEADGRRVKVNPLASWREEDVALYQRVNELPEHPLAAQGYASVGCWPCTTPVAPGEHARAGRWRGQARTECGIHTAANSG